MNNKSGSKAAFIITACHNEIQLRYSRHCEVRSNL